MNRTESIVVGLVLGLVCPLLTFVAFWWSTAAISVCFSVVPVKVVIMAAFTGLAIGITLDFVYLKRWIKVFYTANVWILVVIYLLLNVVAVAVFMGLPAGTFLLGIGAGLYVGHRERHTQTGAFSAGRSLHKGAFLAALVTTVAALPIGILSLDDQGLLEFLGTLLPLGRVDLGGFRDLILVGILCCALFVAQYWCTRIAGRFSYTINEKTA